MCSLRASLAIPLIWVRFDLELGGYEGGVQAEFGFALDLSEVEALAEGLGVGFLGGDGEEEIQNVLICAREGRFYTEQLHWEVEICGKRPYMT